MALVRSFRFGVRAALFAAPLVVATATLAGDSETAFMAENQAAMDKMMTAMTVQPSGDVDADFVAMMVPHHQGAIDMAQAQLRYGRNEHLRRIAQEIIVTQRDEIAAMQLAVAEQRTQGTLPDATRPDAGRLRRSPSDTPTNVAP